MGAVVDEHAAEHLDVGGHHEHRHEVPAPTHAEALPAAELERGHAELLGLGPVVA